MRKLLEEKQAQEDSEHKESEETSFEKRVAHELSLEDKKELLGFFFEHYEKKADTWEKAQPMYGAYEVFVGDVEDREEKRLSPEQLLAGVPDCINLGWLSNGIDKRDWERGDIKESALQTSGVNLNEVDIENTPLAFYDYGSFVHVRCFNGHEFKYDSDIVDDMKYKFYICPEFEKMPDIIAKLVEKYKEKEMPLIAKFSKENSRNDRVVIYSDKESAEGQFDAISEVMSENPDLFENLGKNRLWNKIDGIDGLYFGQDYPYYRGHSFSEDRAKVVGLAAQFVGSLKDRGDVEMDDEIVETLFDIVALSKKINPRSWGGYIDSEDEELTNMGEDADGFCRELSEELSSPEGRKRWHRGFNGYDINKWVEIFPALKHIIPEERRQVVL